MAEYNKLKVKAGKKAASLNQQLERVSEIQSVVSVKFGSLLSCVIYYCVCVCVLCVV